MQLSAAQLSELRRSGYLILPGLFSEAEVARKGLQYGTTLGDPALREMLLDRTSAGRANSGINVDQVVVTAGSNQLLHLVAECLLDPDDIVLCAAPTYLVFLGTLASLGARSLGVASDEGGMIPEALEEQLEALRVRGETVCRVLIVARVVARHDEEVVPVERRHIL